MTQQSNSSEKFFSYVPNEVIFLIHHEDENMFPDGRILLSDLTKLISDDNQDLKTHMGQLSVEPTLLHFSLPPSFGSGALPRFFSMLFAPVGTEQIGPLVTDLYDGIHNRGIPENNIGLPLNDSTSGKNGYLRVAAPNWFMGVEQIHVPTGGPGGRPRPAPAGSSLAFDFSGVADPKALNFLGKAKSESAPVDVVILDAVPPADVMLDAYYDVAASAPNHPLKALLESQQNHNVIARSATPNVWKTPDDFLTIYFEESLGDVHEEFAKLERFLLNGQQHPVTIKDHEYSMYDHGLFIASIVRAIAPNARLTLMEVLNNKGVGTYKSLAEGFNQILKNRNNIPLDQRRPMIVNCSFTFALPVDLYYKVKDQTITVNMLKGTANARLIEGIERYKAPLPQAFVQRIDAAQNAFVAGENPTAVPQQDPFIQDIPYLIQMLCQVLDSKTVIVAAAGNESHDVGGKHYRMPPRYPAKLNFVTGVGALGYDLEPAEYSNIADLPKDAGVMAFGGDLQEVQGKKQMMRGVYSNPRFPRSAKNKKSRNNTTYFAYWSGTSFATPVVSGTLAAMCAYDSSKAPRDYLKNIHDASVEDPVTKELNFPPKQV